MSEPKEMELFELLRASQGCQFVIFLQLSRLELNDTDLSE